MESTKIIGYVLALLGLVVIAFSNKIAALKYLAFLGAKALVYTIVGGVALVAVGIVLVLSEGKKIKHAAEEVPIYEGEGKHRKIVGYRRAS